MVRYKCPECGKYEMKKQVYTEESCKCGHVNHTPHRGSAIKEYNQNQENEKYKRKN